MIDSYVKYAHNSQCLSHAYNKWRLSPGGFDTLTFTCQSSNVEFLSVLQSQWYWPKSLQLTLTYVCAGESRPPLVCNPQLMHSSYNYIRLKCSFVSECEITALFSGVFYVFRDVHKFYFELFTNETKIGDQCTELHAVTELTGSTCFTTNCRRECYGTLSTINRSTAFSWARGNSNNIQIFIQLYFDISKL